MPTYEYIADDPGGCGHCGDGFEVVQSIKDDALTSCPECGGKIHRQLFAPGGHFPGCWPMKSMANAVHPDQRVEAMAAAARAGCPTYYDERGRPEFRDKKHRFNFLRGNRRFDMDAGYGDPTPGDSVKR